MKTYQDIDPSAWDAYQPDDRHPWDLARVGHLHRRAGLQANWATLQRDLNDGPEISVSRLLLGESTSLDGQPADQFDADQNALARQAAASGELEILQAAWLYRLIHSPHPLRERMTLFWHNHFATSQAKVGNLGLMERQNALFREHALGNFGALLKAIGRDPAMLIWLDATTNRKSHPNENYAREVMELFSLGRGHYSEHDIREAARAFTGGFVQGDSYRFVAAQHDAGTKTLFGQSGDFRDEQVAELLIAQPACALFIARKLVALLIDETRAWSDAALKPVAERLRESGFQLAAAVEMIVRSRAFFNESSRRTRVKSPVEMVVGTLRALEAVRPTVSTRALARACERMGQSLFQPPNVAGWPGGMAWINTTALLARANVAAALLSNDADLGRRIDPLALATRYGARSADAQRRFFVDLLLQTHAPASTSGSFNAAEARAFVTGLLAAPEYQLS